MNNAPTRTLIRLAAGSALACVMLVPATAQAWWRGGFFFGGPVIVGAPIVPYPTPYYYPPAYYGPGYYQPPYPPAAYAPPPAQTPAPQLSQAETPFGSTCYAGVYVCPAPAQSHVGTGCSCPGLGAPSYGVVQ